MPLTIGELRSRQTEVRSRLEDINREYEGQELPDAVREEWNKLVEERRGNVTLLEELEARERFVESLGGVEGREEPGAHFNTARAGRATGEDIYDLTTVRMSAGSPEAANVELRDRAMKSIEAAQFPHRPQEREQIQEHIAALVNGADDVAYVSRHVLATGSAVYKRAFGKHLSGASMTADEQRALSLAAGEGGYALPYTLDPTIIKTSNGATNPLRAISRVEQITTNEWKGVSSAGVRASRVRENVEATDDTPSLVQPTVRAERVDVFIPFSLEVGQDWNGLQGEMAVMIQDAKDEEEAASFMTGDGTAPRANGLLTGATTIVRTATRSTLAIADLYTLEEALPDRFNANAHFVGHRGIFNKARQFDTSGGAALWVRLGEGLPPELIGYPAHRSSAMASSVRDRALVLVLGDFRHFLIVDRIGMTIRVIPDLMGENGRPTGQSGIFAIWRNNSKVLTPNAFRVLEIESA